MTRIMLDGIGSDAPAIAAAAKAGRTYRGMRITMAAGYVDGPVSEWTMGQVAAVHGAGLQLVLITVTGRPDAQVADIERGDMDPPSGATWALEQHRAGKFGVLYVNRANKGDVIAACSSSNLQLGRQYGLWVATLDGSFTDSNGSDLRHDPGVVAIQYLPAARAGGPYDVSVVTDPDWMPAPVVVPPWTPAAAERVSNAITELSFVLAMLKAHPHG